MSSAAEVSHYVVTAHPPGGVLHTVKCNFLAPDSEDVVIAKSRRLEIRQLQVPSDDADDGGKAHSSSPFPIVWSVPVNGRITSLEKIQIPSCPTSFLFITTDQQQYAVLGYNPHATPYPVETHASGSLQGEDLFVLGKQAESGPLVAVDPHSRCVVLHLYDGLLTVFPIQTHYTPSTTRTTAGAAASKGFSHSSFASSVKPTSILGPPFHVRLEERTLLSLTMLHHADPSVSALPHVCVLHQDSRGAQHITTHCIDLAKCQLWCLATAGGAAPSGCEWLKKSRIDGGSSLLLPVPPRSVGAAAAAGSSSTTTTTTTTTPTSSVATSGGVVVLGQRQVTFLSMHGYKVMPIPPALILSWDVLPPDVSGMPRFLLGDEFGNLHMLTLITQDLMVVALQLDTLGSCTLANQLEYLDAGIVFCASTLGDSQLVQIHDEPIPVEEQEDYPNNTNNADDNLELDDTTYLSVIEEYTHLGPIVDFDLVPTTPGPHSSTSVVQSQVVTASGSSKSGSLRVIRNGIGMNEYASVELGGIQNMWSLRQSFDDPHHAYLVQSFVGETRVLGVSSSSSSGAAAAADDDDDAMQGMDAQGEVDEEEEAVGGSLEEVVLPGLESNASTLHVSNVIGDLFLQITESQLRLANREGDLVDTWSPSASADANHITVASANEAGQVVIALRGGLVVYFEISNQKISKVDEKQMDKEVSCLNLNPFTPSTEEATTMQVDGRVAHKSSLVAVGLWDDFTVRMLSLETKLMELLQIHLSTQEDEDEAEEAALAQGQRRNRNNMMSRSLCLITLDFSATHSSDRGNNSANATSTTSPGVNMLFVGLGDGTLVSFAVVQPEDGCAITVQSKKEVSLGTQRINLIPLHTERGGTCVLATGDRPTVIYLAGVGGASNTTNFNPKLCYSNVNLSPAEEDQGDGMNDVSRPHAQQSIAVNVAASFFSPLLFDAVGNEHYSLCVADDSNLRLGVIDDIQKLHVTTCRLGMAPRRIVHCPEGRMFAVGCIESGIKQVGMGPGGMNMGNCIRFLDDTTFDDIERIDLEPYEMVLSMVSATLRIFKSSSASTDTTGISTDMDETDSAVEYRSYLIVGTAYAFHDEDEPTKGRILVYSCNQDDGNDTSSSTRAISTVAELQVRGGVYSMCQFYDGKLLVTVNSKTQVCQMVDGGTGIVRLSMVGVGHHGHILSLFVKSRACKMLGEAADSTAPLPGSEEQKPKAEEEKLAIVGDLMRSISLVQYYPQHETLEEVARDFNANWTTAVEMLTDDLYLGGENWNNLFVLRRNTKAQSEEIRCRLDTVGEFHLGEMCNKFMSGSLVMPHSTSSASNAGVGRSGLRRALASPTKNSATDAAKVAASPVGASAALRSRRPAVIVGSQTLFGTVDGTLGAILGLDGPTSAFFATLERSMECVIKPVGNFSHQQFRAFNAEQRVHPSHGFVDGDLVESFLDLDRSTMESVVQQMNRDGGWEIDDSAFTAAGANEKDAATPASMEDDERPELAVEDVLAVVEEMIMLH